MNPHVNPHVNPISAKKLLLSKWTAVQPRVKAAHLLVSKVILPESSAESIEWVEIEAVIAKRARRIPWRELQDGQG